ncbi:uncharacterized protein L969DRAFT_43096 [Mixia osmundae IAM 14324]|uniref:DNA mismatch repair proteins mutS family domain-containing protein n=1 Tax=Mixia osmundae (strain CBS 9802 / IAM 14324 / JCM 22182 / KY 12970) TaxID=764103 RepID=G7DTC9_MIXOS|nr:uncharacterized protein L969DRAFT_43096 [Mixia osmundae IAM 14324]KEI42887.1 hypothetical protein L969DRAFT_43096 [Mixia osmundae IAM 14324]GAA93776.1 hypothetical protein E5Q_00422 [Mixia osmundae IAM 14324]
MNACRSLESLPRLFCCQCRSTLPVQARQVHPSRAYSSEIDLFGKTTIKKAYDDLPRTLTDASGRSLAPLPVLEQPIVVRKRRRKAAPTEEPNLEPQEPVVKPKAKRKTKVKVAENPAEPSVIPAIPDPDQLSSRLAQEVLRNARRFPHALLLTRVGQFYESYFDQAPLIADLLSIKLTSKRFGGFAFPFCGFPLAQLDKHLKTLVQDDGRFVAICEEFKIYHPPTEGTHQVPPPDIKRKVTRVVTPGTLIDETFLNVAENNFLLSIVAPSERNAVGLAWLDVSTGDFFVQESDLEALEDDLARIRPREILLDSKAESPESTLREICAKQSGVFVSFVQPDGKIEQKHDETQEASVTEAIGLLSTYIKQTLLDVQPDLNNPIRRKADVSMTIDAVSLDALEIRETSLLGSAKGSLLSNIRRVVTGGGRRLLESRICSPSTDLQEIEARQAIVDIFHTHRELREDVRDLLRPLDDTSRKLQRISLNRSDPSDLLSLRAFILSANRIRETILLAASFAADQVAWTRIISTAERINDHTNLARAIEAAVDDEGYRKITEANAVELDADGSETGEADLDEATPNDLRATAPLEISGVSDNWVIRANFSPDFADAHAALTAAFVRAADLAQELRMTFASEHLSLRVVPKFGAAVHVRSIRNGFAQIEKSGTATPLQKNASTRLYSVEQWTLLNAEIQALRNRIREMEQNAFRKLCDDILDHFNSLRKNASLLDELDVAAGFAELAHETGMARPTITNDLSMDIISGRHPSVEQGLQRQNRPFTANSTGFAAPDMLCHIITGPNMGGKSTYLRQTALIAILAQTGGYVPAERARIGMVDRVFTRIGAKDDLYRDRSTFMVEMIEVAEILNKATSRSLVVMDEVGRGSATIDGVAISYATLNHLLSINRCRTLFATHFHELADILDGDGPDARPGIKFYCTDIIESDDGSFSYSHRVRPGINRDSHGIRVAQIAGLPIDALDTARVTMQMLRERKANGQTGLRWQELTTTR